MTAGPLLVFGPRSTTYDFGPEHPLTPRRFGPGMALLRALGGEPGLAPEPASDADLLLAHTEHYLRVVKRLSDHPDGPAEAGIGRGGDDPAFPGMHQAAAAVAGGSLRAMEALLHGGTEHAFHPGGGLHHAMPDRASGFCIYDDPALAIALARRAGRRVLYLDFDVHHGDGVQAIHLDDPGVMTVSFHESGRYLFPGTGFVNELGWGAAAGTSVNMPFEPTTGEGAWLTAVRALGPALAAAFGPDLVVSQHGADSHAWDPLAHLLVTTTAMGAAARLTDAVAHRYARGAWLSTGGGGYDAYRVVPRTWSLVWLAAAHHEVPLAIPDAWREQWAAEGARYRQAPLPVRFDDPPNAGLPFDAEQEDAERQSLETMGLVRRLVVPQLLREAEDRGWWSAADELGQAALGASALSPAAAASIVAGPGAAASPRVVAPLSPEHLDRLVLAPRMIPPLDPAAARRLLRSALAGGARAAAAILGDEVVGLALIAPSGDDGGGDAWHVIALGVAPHTRRRGLATALLRTAADLADGAPLVAESGVAERDPVEPLPVELRASVARRLFEAAGFRVARAPHPVGRADGAAQVAHRP